MEFSGVLALQGAPRAGGGLIPRTTSPESRGQHKAAAVGADLTPRADFLP